MLSRLKFEISNLVNEMLNQIPDEIWESEDRTFIDPAMGGGQFVKEIERRLREKGHSDENISNRVFGMEKNKLRVNYAINKHGLIGKYWVGDHESEIDMKFDVVVGNPPYQKGTWIKFLKKSINLSKKSVLIISPDATNNYTDRSDKLNSLLKSHGLQKKIPCSEYFLGISAGTIVAYIVDKDLPFNEEAFEDKSIDGTIVKKILSSSKEKIKSILSSKRGKQSSEVRKSQTEFYNSVKNVNRIRNDEVEIFFIEKKSTTIINGEKYWLANRYFGKNLDANVLEINETIGISPNILAIERVDGLSINNFKRIYLSKLFRFILEYLRNGKFDTSPTMLNQLPLVNNPNVDLYSYFDLTTEEIQHIEENIA